MSETQTVRTKRRRATAFDEMRILEQEGRHGWHLVDFGPWRLDLEASDHPWQHLRLAWPSPAVLQALSESGWTLVGRWAWWAYLKRPTPPADSD